MTFIGKVIKSGSHFLQSFKTDHTKKLLELEQLDQKMAAQQKKERNTDSMPFALTNRTFIKFWWFGILIIFVWLFVYKSLNVLYLIFMAYIISLAMEAIIDFLQQKLHYRGIAIAIAYVGMLILLLGAMVFIIPFILNQVSDIITIFINNIANFQDVLTTKSIVGIVKDTHWIPWTVQKALLESFSDPNVVSSVQSQLQQNISQMINMGTTYAKNIWSMAVNAVGSFVSFITQLSIVLTLSVLFSIQKDAVMKFIARLGGEKKYKFIYMKLERIYKKLGIWFKSQGLLCVFIGVTMYAMLWILAIFGIDLPQKWSLAAIAAMTEFIPYIGPIIWWVAAALVAFVNYGIYGALIVMGAVLVIQWLENNVFIPLLMNKTLGINPVVIFLSMIIWWIILGFVGVLLAVPIAVIITLILEKTLEE